MDPVAQILAQGQTRDEGATPQLQAYQAGVNQSLSRRNLDLQEARERRIAAEEAVLLPLKIAGQIQENKMRDITLAAQFQSKQDQLNAASAITELGAQTSAALQTGDANYPMLFGRWIELGSKFPGAKPMIEPMLETLKQSADYSGRLQGIKEMIEGRKDAANARIDAAQTARDAQMTPAMRNATAIKEAEDRGDTRLAALLREQTINAGQTFESITDPATGQVTTRLIQGGRGSAPKDATAPTTGFLTIAQKSLPELDEAFQIGERLSDSINPSVVGALGTLNKMRNIGVDNFAALFNMPEFTQFRKEGVTEYETLVNGYASATIRMIKADSNPAQPEIQRMRKAVPDTGVKESAETAHKKLEIMQMLIAEKARFLAKRAGLPVPNQFLLPNEVETLVKGKTLTPEEGLAILRHSPYIVSRKNPVTGVEEEFIMDPYTGKPISPYPPPTPEPPALRPR